MNDPQKITVSEAPAHYAGQTIPGLVGELRAASGVIRQQKDRIIDLQGINSRLIDENQKLRDRIEAMLESARQAGHFALADQMAHPELTDKVLQL